MELTQWFKGNAALGIIKLFQSRVNGRKIGKDIDKKADGGLGEKASEKIQRGPITTFFGQILEGLWAENPQSLAVWHELQAKDIRRNLNKGGKR